MFTIWECPNCGIGLTDPVPTESTSHLLYATRESGDFQLQDTGLMESLKAVAARRDVRAICRGIQIPDGAYMLDFGCGNGAFVKVMQSLWPLAKVIGADTHPSPPPGLRSEHYCSYEKLSEMRGAFEVILCRHVLEHTYDPVAMLRFLRGLLTPSGILIIEVPSLETKVKSLFGKYWDGYYAPFHPIHFTESALAHVLKKAGFDVVRQGGAEMPKMGRSLRNFLGCSYGTWLFALGLLLQPVQVAIGLLTGTSVCLRAWARPTSR